MTHSKPTHPLPVHFPPKLYTALKEIAESRGVSVTSLVIRACDEFVFGQPEAIYPKESENRGPSEEDVQWAINQLKKELESPEMAKLLGLENDNAS